MSPHRQPDNDKTEVLHPPQQKRSRRTERALEKFVVEEIEIGAVPPAGPQRKQRRRLPAWWPVAKTLGTVAGLWLILIVAAMVVRSPWPPDETRFLGIAWDSLQARSLVPQLNGVVVGQPPLFSWLVLAGWKLFGISEWWPRLLPGLFGLANLYLAMRLGRRLWPASPEAARYAPFVLLGTVGFALMLTFTTPAMLVLFAVLLGNWALTIMWRGRDMRAWLLLAAALVIGTLAGGPFTLVYVVPLALLAPLWANEGPKLNWKYWYYDVTKSVAAALIVQAFWALAAARVGGGGFAATFLATTRQVPVLDLFPLTQSWWWYLMLLPTVLLPWFIWPVLWLRLWHIRREPLNAGFVFCLVWVTLPLILLSLLGVKQPPLLLPLVPASALVTAWLLFDEKFDRVGDDRALAGMMAPVIVIGAALAVLPSLRRTGLVPEMLINLSPLVGVGLMVIGFALGWLPHRPVRERALEMAMMVVALTVLALVGAASQFDAFLRVDEVAQHLAQPQQQGRPVAHVGSYDGQYQFAGRLPRPLDVIEPAQVADWAAANPAGVLVSSAGVWQPRTVPGAAPMLRTIVRDDQIVVWDAAALAGPGP
jgi:4-amino-4-deoxy-L-arabinose transferase-like glycosyltransferase